MNDPSKIKYLFLYNHRNKETKQISHNQRLSIDYKGYIVIVVVWGCTGFDTRFP